MDPIRDIGEIHPGAVLYHSAFGFAQVIEIEPSWIQLDWEGKGDNLPSQVAHDVVVRVYARCAEGGFFHRASHEHDALQQLLQENPAEGLALLLADLHGPQREQDLREWIVGRGLMAPAAFQHWWKAVQPSLTEDLRFRSDPDGIALRSSDAGEGPHARLDNPMLAPGRRLDLALAHREELDDAFFLDQVLLSWRTGSTQVKDLALAAVRDREPEEILSNLLELGPDAIDAIIHGIRRGGWAPDDVPAELHEELLELALHNLDHGGPLDNEGRLSATLARWPSEGLVEALSEQASVSDGRRLLRATFSALPPRRAELLALEMLDACLQRQDSEAAQWVGGEILALALIDQHELADRIEDEQPALSDWFRTAYRGIDPKHTLPEYDERTEETPHTAEIDLSEVVSQPIPLSKLPTRSGASLLGMGLAMARALSVHHKEGRVVNPNADTMQINPNESMEVRPSARDEGDCPRPLIEEPSPTSDVYAASVLLLEALLGRRWPRNLPASRAIPYLRTAIPLLPPSALAPLDAGLHPDPSLRPRDGLEWLARWQTAAVTEESRAYAARDPEAQLRIGYDSHVGRMKVLLTQINQDCLFLGAKGPLSLLVVCDGISTANAGSGDIASSIACHVIANLWEQALPRLFNAGPSDLKDFLDRALRMANTAICEAALRFASGNLDGRVPMGTTCTVAVVHGNWVSMAWLGDSRAYLVGPYGASLLTADENQAGERLKAWHLNFLDAWDPAGFALVGYLGHFDDMLRPEALSAHHTSFTLLPGESLTICSDGVTDYIGDTHPEVASILAHEVLNDDPDDGSRHLVALANRGGGGDNATCLIARLWD
ncbi:MAG TPA: hypothetical protein ENK18_02980 [Deltaproteobacteria bacterium]|nr:hypothetical protein [Deltaproteobacteria bacterium]